MNRRKNSIKPRIDVRYNDSKATRQIMIITN